MPPRVPPGRAAGRVLRLRRDGLDRWYATFGWSCRSVGMARGIASGGGRARWHSLNDMGLRACAQQNRLAVDVLLAVFFVVLDTVLTLAGTSWWPAHPSTLAWTMLAVQGLADASLVFRRRAPMIVIAILGGVWLGISLLLSPPPPFTPEHAANR